MTLNLEEPLYRSQKTNTEPTGDAVPIGVTAEMPLPMSDADDAVELVEELAATATLNQAFAEFRTYLNDTFEDLNYTSEDGNPVRTHLHLVAAEEDVLQRTHELEEKLLEQLAKRGEEITEKGGLLRTQVIDEEN